MGVDAVRGNQRPRAALNSAHRERGTSTSESRLCLAQPLSQRLVVWLELSGSLEAPALDLWKPQLLSRRGSLGEAP